MYKYESKRKCRLIKIEPWDETSSNVHNSIQQSNSYIDDDDDDEEEEEEEEEEDSSDSLTSKSDLTDLRCCLLSACCETCTCCTMSKQYDSIYYRIQNLTKSCPNACPSIVPKVEEEEWKYPSNRNAREYAMCQCCYSPSGIICMKYLDILCCPLFPIWDMFKGCDYGYRRFRIQAILDRYKDSHKQRYITCI
ncbi:unnamed protein product [Heterobilharzia americana]|nr:unnamed protein product [Heterobilharzia americana]